MTEEISQAQSSARVYSFRFHATERVMDDRRALGYPTHLARLKFHTRSSLAPEKPWARAFPLASPKASLSVSSSFTFRSPNHVRPFLVPSSKTRSMAAVRASAVSAA